jgi:predicted metal-binding membrane protein
MELLADGTVIKRMDPVCAPIIIVHGGSGSLEKRAGERMESAAVLALGWMVRWTPTMV